MTINELINKINKMETIRETTLISFTNNKSVFFQYFGASHLNLKKFIEYNCEAQCVKSINKCYKTKYGCIVVEVE